MTSDYHRSDKERIIELEAERDELRKDLEAAAKVTAEALARAAVDLMTVRAENTRLAEALEITAGALRRAVRQKEEP